MCIVRHFWPADIGLAKTFFLSVIPRLGQSNDVIFFFTLLATHGLHSLNQRLEQPALAALPEL